MRKHRPSPIREIEFGAWGKSDGWGRPWFTRQLLADFILGALFLGGFIMFLLFLFTGSPS